MGTDGTDGKAKSYDIASLLKRLNQKNRGHVLAMIDTFLLFQEAEKAGKGLNAAVRQPSNAPSDKGGYAP